MQILKNDNTNVLPLNPVYSVLRVSTSDIVNIKVWTVVRLYQSQNYWKAYHFWKARKGTGVVLVAE